MINQTPPRWAKNAIATPQGWRNPKTGELLIAKRGLVVETVPVETIIELDQSEKLIENSFVEIETTPLTTDSVELQNVSENNEIKRSGGRPKGSKNKTK